MCRLRWKVKDKSGERGECENGGLSVPFTKATSYRTSLSDRTCVLLFAAAGTLAPIKNGFAFA
jgi:hypothetical protein